MTREEAINYIDGWTLYSQETADEVCDHSGIKRIKADVKWKSKKDAIKQGIAYLQEPDKPGEGVWALTLGYHICEELGVDSFNSYIGRGSQARAIRAILRKHFGLGGSNA